MLFSLALALPVVLPAALAAPPTLPAGALLLPSFTLSDGHEWSAGTAFVAQTPSGPALVTALHLFGPASGALNHQLSYAAVQQQRARVIAVDPTSERVVVDTQSVRPLAEAETNDFATDIAAFDIHLDAKGHAGGRVRVTPLPLEGRCPAPDSPLYLPTDGTGATGGFLQASVLSCDARTLTYTLPRGAVLGGTSGAPLLDQEGHIWGMALGSTNSDPPRGLGMSGPALLAHLSGQRLVPPPPPPSPWGVLNTGWAAIPNPWGYDLPGLHAVLLPGWGLAGWEEDTLREGLNSSPLLPLFAEIARLPRADTPENIHRVSAHIDAWNQVYRDASIPLETHIAAHDHTLAWMTWFIEARAVVRLGDTTTPVALVSRMDRLPLADAVPTLLPDSEGAIVPLEAARDTSLYDVWSQLVPGVPLYAPLVAELQAVVGEGLPLLLRTAPYRRTLDAVTQSVQGRSPCSHFEISRLPWWGLDRDLDAQLSTRARPSGSCAPLLDSELSLLRFTTVGLTTNPALERALQRLSAHLARSLALEAAGMRRACVSCGWEERVPPGMIAALSDPPTRVTALVRLCRRAAHDPTLNQALQRLQVCSAQKVPASLGPAIAAQWPAAWGPPTLSIEGLPAYTPVRWPRDVAR